MFCEGSMIPRRAKQAAPWKEEVEREQAESQRTLRTAESSRSASLTPYLQSLTPIQMKVYELDNFKKTVHGVLARFNNLRLEYMDWYKNRIKTFITVLKSVLAIQGPHVAVKISNIEKYRSVYKHAKNLASGSRLISNFQPLDTFFSFWVRFQQIMEDLDKEVILALNQHCESVTSLRQPEVKAQIDLLYDALLKASCEDFDFSECHNEKDNLFTYGLMTSDNEFHGLVAYIPYLIDYAAKICYLTTRISVEKL